MGRRGAPGRLVRDRNCRARSHSIVSVCSGVEVEDDARREVRVDDSLDSGQLQHQQGRGNAISQRHQWLMREEHDSSLLGHQETQNHGIGRVEEYEIPDRRNWYSKHQDKACRTRGKKRGRRTEEHREISEG